MSENEETKEHDEEDEEEEEENTIKINDKELEDAVTSIIRKITQKNETGVLEDINETKNFRNSREQSIFNIFNTEGNNIFMLSCKYGLTNVCTQIIEYYDKLLKSDEIELFSLGRINFRGKTALMICISNGSEDVALKLLEYPESLPELFNERLRNRVFYFIRNSTNIQILNKIINLYFEYHENDQRFHEFLNKICQDKNLIERLQNVSVLNFNRICGHLENVQGETPDPLNPNLTNVLDIRQYNLRRRPNLQNARNVPPHAIIAENVEPQNPYVSNFDPNVYTDEQMENFRIRNRSRSFGGRKKYKKRKTTKRKKTTKRRKYTRNFHKKTIRL
jgi:hypothetical protein